MQASCWRSASDIADSWLLIARIEFGRNDQAIDRAPIVVRQVEMQAGERRDGAAGAEQAQRGERSGIAPRPGDAFGERREAIGHQLAHVGVARLPTGHVAALIAAGFGQRDDPPGHALPVENARHGVGAFDQHQLGRAAADIEDQRRPVAGFEQDMAAEHRQPRFLARGDDIERNPGFEPHPLDELLAVRRPAARLGRDRAGEMDIAAAELVGADLQRPQRAVHRRLVQPPGLGHALAQPDDPAEGIDDGEILARRPGDQQAAIVGAEIDRGIGLLVEQGRTRIR